MLKPNIILLILLILFLVSNFAYSADKDHPIKIQSKYVEFNNITGITTYKGDVVLEQGSRHVTADVLKIQNNKNNNKIEQMVAVGNPANFKLQPNSEQSISTGKANTIKYFINEEKIDLIGNAELIQDEKKINGPIITYFLDKGLLTSQSSKNEKITIILTKKTG